MQFRSFLELLPLPDCHEGNITLQLLRPLHFQLPQIWQRVHSIVLIKIAANRRVAWLTPGGDHP